MLIKILTAFALLTAGSRAQRTACGIVNESEDFYCVAQQIRSVPLTDTLSWSSKSIKLMNLSSNEMSILHEDSFKHFPKLVYLDVSNNRLHKITEKTFIHTANLRTLMLNNNDLVIRDSGLSPASLNHLSSLETLDLSGNPLERIPQRFFDSLTKLRSLNLNRIPGGLVIENGAFSSLDSLEWLSLSSDKEERLPPNLHKELERLPKLHMIVLPRDQLICDCYLKELLRFLVSVKQNRKIQVMSEDNQPVVCKGPDRFKGRSITDIVPSELNVCYGKEEMGRKRIINSTEVVVDAGKVLTMTCTFLVKMPIANRTKIVWSKNGKKIDLRMNKLEESTYQLSSEEVQSNLTIYDTKSTSDEGRYTCSSVLDTGKVLSQEYFEILVRKSAEGLLEDLLNNKLYVMITAIVLVVVIVTCTYAIAMLRNKGQCSPCGRKARPPTRDKCSTVYLPSENIQPPVIGGDCDYLEGHPADYSGLKRVSVSYETDAFWGQAQPTYWTQQVVPCPVHVQAMGTMSMRGYQPFQQPQMHTPISGYQSRTLQY
ncbi:hypothetical protein Ciccas_001307 [Cichlidogyrus casuarinus]|uniref:Ig-like domain-containing protein n=1 Tax=Cichlidogyrus casuarinus TaxID=1844966 RepID=A0ABD2QKF1_9PLAT